MADADKVYAALGDFRNIEKVKHLLPQDKISELEYEADFIRFKVDGLIVLLLLISGFNSSKLNPEIPDFC